MGNDLRRRLEALESQVAMQAERLRGQGVAMWFKFMFDDAAVERGEPGNPDLIALREVFDQEAAGLGGFDGYARAMGQVSDLDALHDAVVARLQTEGRLGLMQRVLEGTRGERVPTSV